MYTKKVLQHFTNPKFFGKIKNPDVIGKAGNLRCGDLLTLYLKIDKGKIKDIRFETLGCASAIASSDIICKLSIGKTLKQAAKLTFKDVVKELGGLPSLKIHCAQLVTEALNDAIGKYKK